MPCPSVTTGDEFLIQMLSHLDCQAQSLGSFGYQSLATAGSPASLALTALLTLFIALYGIRLLFGLGGGPRDVVNGVLKIGIVLTIAVSWPAWRIVVHDVVLHGPAEIAATVMLPTLPGSSGSFTQRLQGIDTGIAALTAIGAGRQTGEVIDSGQLRGFRAIALEDEAGFGWSRTIYLASTIGSLAMLRIAGGLLLALAPLFAGLLLFDLTRGLFSGWLRGLVLVALGSLGMTVLLSIQLAVMEPWLADALNRRNLGYATPTAPTELLALVGGFAAATAGLLFLLAKVAFQTGWIGQSAVIPWGQDTRPRDPALSTGSQPVNDFSTPSRAIAISQSIATTVRREDREVGALDPVRLGGLPQAGGQAAALAGHGLAPSTPLGSGYRRDLRSGTHSQQRRDNRR